MNKLKSIYNDLIKGYDTYDEYLMQKYDRYGLISQTTVKRIHWIRIISFASKNSYLVTKDEVHPQVSNINLSPLYFWQKLKLKYLINKGSVDPILKYLNSLISNYSEKLRCKSESQQKEKDYFMTIIDKEEGTNKK
jgi:hypothetical protein